MNFKLKYMKYKNKSLKYKVGKGKKGAGAAKKNQLIWKNGMDHIKVKIYKIIYYIHKCISD